MTPRLLPPPPLPRWLSEQLPFNRRLFTDDDYAVHFIDHGDGPPVLLQHGNPTWCYLWRKVISILVRRNVRVIAPDLIGLGLSSKPRDPRIHSLDFHAGMISSLVEALDLRSLTIAGQDWGGPVVGVTAARNRQRIRAAVFANTAIRVPRRRPRRSPFHRFSHLPLVSDLVFRIFNFPIPLSMTPIDRDSNGLVDSVYFGNIGGHLFKLDLTSPDQANWTVKVIYKTNITTQATEHIFRVATDLGLDPNLQEVARRSWQAADAELARQPRHENGNQRPRWRGQPSRHDVQGSPRRREGIRCRDHDRHGPS